MNIKLRLEQQDPDFAQRHFIIKKFFCIEKESMSLDVSSRHFKIYFQRLNMKVLKFVKILTFNINEDDLACIMETRSLSLEFLSLQRLKNVYQDFLSSFETSLKEDLRVLKEDKEKLNHRVLFALIYRIEQKRILVNQIRLIDVVLIILSRLMRGMTLEFAVTRVFDLESKKEYPINRLMIDNYLSSLKAGLEKNKDDYMKIYGVSENEIEQMRMLRVELPKVSMKHFEVKGYGKMLDRMLDLPLKQAAADNNMPVYNEIMLLKDQLKFQEQYQ